MAAHAREGAHALRASIDRSEHIIKTQSLRLAMLASSPPCTVNFDSDVSKTYKVDHSGTVFHTDDLLPNSNSKLVFDVLGCRKIQAAHL